VVPATTSADCRAAQQHNAAAQQHCSAVLLYTCLDILVPSHATQSCSRLESVLMCVCVGRICWAGHKSCLVGLSVSTPLLVLTHSLACVRTLPPFLPACLQVPFQPDSLCSNQQLAAELQAGLAAVEAHLTLCQQQHEAALQRVMTLKAQWCADEVSGSISPGFGDSSTEC